MRDVLFEMICSACATAIELLKAEGHDKGLLCREAEYLVVTATFTYIEISNRFQGESVYISRKPRGRDQKIKDAFRGNNVDEVAKTFGVNRATVYRAIKRPAKKQEDGVVEMMMDGLFQRISLNINININAIKSSNWETTYRKFAASKTFKHLLQNEI